MKKNLVLSIMALLAVSSAVFAYNYDTNLPLAGNTATTVDLQKEMLFPVYSYGLRVATPECKDFSITNTEVSKAKVDGAWEEIWTLKACERTARIPIKFTEEEGKTIFAIDPINVKVAK